MAKRATPKRKPPPFPAWAGSALGLGVALLLVLVSRLLAFRAWPVGLEDAYITFRVARNWAAGLGPYFNPGDPVGSVTSLPWTAWMSLGFLCHADPVAWSRVTSLTCDLAAVLCAWRLLKQRVWLFGVLYALPWFAATSASGLETSAVSAALVASTTLPAHGLLGALRPEGLPLAFLLSRRERHTLLALAGFAVVAILNVCLFHALFPTAQAKAQVYGVHWFAGATYLAGLMPQLAGLSHRGAQILDHAGIVAPVLLLGLWCAARRQFWMLAAGLLPIAGYWAIGAIYFWWYVIPSLALLGLVACLGLARFRQRLVGPAMAVLAILATGPAIRDAAGYWGREQELWRVAQTIGPLTGTMFLEPIGVIGYQCPQLRLVDEIGLATPWVAARRRGGPGWMTDVIDKERPEWLLMRAVAFTRPMQSWVGTGDPFRSRAERERLVAGYTIVAMTDWKQFRQHPSASFLLAERGVIPGALPLSALSPGPAVR